MMNGNGLFAAKVRQPAKPEPQWPTWLERLLDVLMEPLQRSDCKTGGRHLLRLAHHLSLVRAVTVQRNQQGRWSSCGDVQIVVKIDPGREPSVVVWIDDVHRALILWILCEVSIAGA